MGVAGFSTWFSTQYPDAFVPLGESFDHVYIDVSTMLHQSLRKGWSCCVFPCGPIFLKWHLDSRSVSGLCEPITYPVSEPLFSSYSEV